MLNMGSTWVAIYRIKIPHLIDHNEPDAERLAKEILQEEGVLGFTDMEDWELLSLDPLVEEDSETK